MSCLSLKPALEKILYEAKKNVIPTLLSVFPLILVFLPMALLFSQDVRF
jgi:hypothetical protein